MSQKVKAYNNNLETAGKTPNLMHDNSLESVCTRCL